MSTPIQQLIQRKANKEIDVRLTLHLVAKELIAQKDDERRVRNSRRYRNAVRAAFKDNGGLALARAELVRKAYYRLRVKASDSTKTLNELWDHVTYNRDHGYLTNAGTGMVLKS